MIRKTVCFKECSPHFNWRFLEQAPTSFYGTPQNLTRSHCNTVHHTATHCNVLQHTATHCNTLQHTATHCITLQHTATHCNTLQHTATHCKTLQHTTTRRVLALCAASRMWVRHQTAIIVLVPPQERFGISVGLGNVLVCYSCHD